MRALLATSICAALLPVGCSRSTTQPAGLTTGEQQQEAFTQACVGVSAKHPGTMAAMAAAVGGSPSDCVKLPGTCICTWSFFATLGTRKIVGAAQYADGSDAVKDTTPMLLGKTGPLVDVPDDEVQQGFLSGRYWFRRPDVEVPVRGKDGTIGTIEAGELEDAVKKGGWVVISHSAWKNADLEKRYEKLSLADRLSQCTSSPGKMISVQLGDEEPVLYQGQTLP